MSFKFEIKFINEFNFLYFIKKKVEINFINSKILKI